ncbi:armadillo-type protein [Phycomyces nitens]|nr:armadillo-type protein [Phycomyces nitens]
MDTMELSAIARVLGNSRDQDCLESLVHLRVYLTQTINDSSRAMETVISWNLLERLRCLLQINEPDIQFECAWILTNLAAASAKYQQHIVDAGFFPPLLHCLTCAGHSQARVQASWALSNLTAESDMLREQWMYHGSHTMISQLRFLCTDQTSQDPGTLQDRRVLAWSLSNMCRGGFESANYHEMYLGAFDALGLCVLSSDRQLYTIGCWGLSRILDIKHPQGFYESLCLSPGLCHRLVGFLSHRDEFIVPVLNVIYSLVSGPWRIAECFLRTDIMTHLLHWMTLEASVPLRTRGIRVARCLFQHQQTEKLIFQEVDLESILLSVGVPNHIYCEAAVQWIVSSKETTTWCITQEVLLFLFYYFKHSSDGLISTLGSYRIIPKSLATILHHPNLPLDTSVQSVKTLSIFLNRLTSLDQQSICGSTLLQEAILPSLSFLCQLHQSDLLYHECNHLQSLLYPLYKNGLQNEH